MKLIDTAHYLETLAATRRPFHERYYAMYSSVLGGVVVDPLLMQVPVDDHLVHRGDGVFDTFKCVARGAYNMEPHLKRLVRSAGEIGLVWPEGVEDLRAKVVETLVCADKDACSVRVILARGPGGMGVSPYESPRPSLYIMVYAAGTPFMKAHPEGARVKRSSIPVKAGNFSTYKHCNYLSNVLMKREAVDGGVDFVVSFDTRGFLAEGATENVGIVTQDRALLFPRMEYVLDGTTMLRVMELAQGLVEEGVITRIAFEDISEERVYSASELLVIGTTLNVASASHYEGRTVGACCPGPIGKCLDLLLERDILGNSERRTRY